MINQFFTNEYTQVIQKLVKEVVNDPATYKGALYMPSIALPVQQIVTEVIEASGGLTNEHLPGTAPQYVQSFGTRVQTYSPPYYKEGIHYDEAKILNLREIGNNGRNVRGVQQYIDLDIDRLNRRLEARIEKLRWDTLFNGGFSWMGKTLSFGIPAANKVFPVTAVWMDGSGNYNAAANPLIDLRYWLMGGYAPFRKYNVTKIIMNGNTERWILDNPNTRAFVTSFGANPGVQQYDLNKVLSFLAPGLPPVEVYKGWYQPETTVSGKLTVGNATFFIPDGKIFFECSLPGNDKVGEFVQGAHLASGSIDNPGFGKFLVVEDNTAPGTKGGPANPYVDIFAGVYGGPKLDRAFDVLTADVTTLS